MKKLIVAAFAVVGLVFGGATVANATAQETWWLVPAGAQLEVTDHPQGDGHRVGYDGFPQTLIGGEAEIPCGRYAQVDLYPAGVVDGLTADGVLYEGEDYDTIISWRFVYGGDCEPTAPTETPMAVPPTLAETGVWGDGKYFAAGMFTMAMILLAGGLIARILGGKK